MRNSFLLALLIAIGLGVWLSTGSVTVGGSGDDTPALAEQKAEANGNGGDAISVQVQRFVATPRREDLILRGRTEANDRVEVRAETEGTVEQLAVRKGDVVTPGQLLCRIDSRTRRAILAQQKAQLEQATADYEAAASLSKKGFAAETRVRALRAQRDAAQAAVEAAEWDLSRVSVTAPIGGVIEELPVRQGSLLHGGDLCAKIVDPDPMLAVAQVSEQDLSGLTLGMSATVSPVTGGTFSGEIAFIAPASEVATRTFRVDILLANPDGALRDGVTSEIVIPLAERSAHLVPPSVLVLSDAGDVGVHSVNSENRVRFLAVDIIADTRQGVWVSGLPDEVTIITVGQEYVGDDALVEPVLRTAADTAPVETQ
ncbi:MAG: efflux RND transporter periplasmic adaptor subunit [Pseudomonadota bacterium]